MFSRFEYDGTTCGKSGTKLPGSHQQREVPGDDLPNDPHRLAQCIGKIGAWPGNRDGVAFNLGGPACHVAEHVDGKRAIGHTGNPRWLPIVEGFKLGKLLAIYRTSKKRHFISSKCSAKKVKGT